MAKKHDENKDLKSFSRVGKINYYDKTLRASKKAIIGIRMWGKIDYLTHYCGWTFMYDNSVGIRTYNNNDDDSNSNKIKNTNARKASKEHSLNNKTKKPNKHS